VIVSDSLNPSGVIWFGPYKYFVPGNYSVTFRLKTVFGGSQLALQVTSERGSNLISQRMINGGEFKGTDEWQDFSLTFGISEITKLEFRGLSMSNQTNVTLDYVKVLQVSP
jgi:nicotinamide mononucleotide adenylyltransferase